ncbi:hypothetical protein [Nonomuraea sp. 10N515B]
MAGGDTDLGGQSGERGGVADVQPVGEVGAKESLSALIPEQEGCGAFRRK